MNVQFVPPAKSNFVTVVAWIGIALSGFTTAISIVQNIVVQLVFDDTHMGQLSAAAAAHLPAFAVFLFAHFRALALVTLLVFATILIASIGLLRRRNWARMIVVGLLAVAICWNVAGLVLQFTVFTELQRMPGANVPASFGAFTVVIGFFAVVSALGFSILYGWLIKRLLSPAVAAEFGR